MFTTRFERLPVYLLATIPQKKRDLIALGVDVIDLGAGDADLAPPPGAVAALKSAAEDPTMSRYGFGLGLPAYREAVSAWMQKRFGHTFDPLKEVVPLIGSKEGIGHLAFAYLQKGDVAIIPDPGYLAYLGGTLLSEAEPYLYPITPRTNFLVELDEIPADVLKRAKILYLNYPNNPTAAVAPVEYLERVVRRCKELGIIIVYDNAYSEMTFDGYVAPSIFDVPGARDVAIEFHSLSKTYNMTGWRSGAVIGNADLVSAYWQLKTNIDSGMFEAIQEASVAALASDQSSVAQMCEIYRRRRDVLVEALRAIGVEVNSPKGTIYLWARVPAGQTSAAFCERVLEEAAVVISPGSAYGPSGEGFIRMSLTVPDDRLNEAAQRIARLVA